jgi:hypothetical protein
MANRETKPKLNEMKTWTLGQVREQYEREHAEHVALLDSPTIEREYVGGPDYHSATTRYYRLGYMRWVLNGSPQPMPQFV